MQLHTISYQALIEPNLPQFLLEDLQKPLYESGIIAVSDIPGFEAAMEDFFVSYRNFSALELQEKKLYEPTRQNGDHMGFELGAEQYIDPQGNPLPADDKKASYYATYPESDSNRWPQNSSIQSSFNKLAKIMFETGLLLFKNTILNENAVLDFDRMHSLGRMLHYHKEGAATNFNPDWCGGHYDHGLFTALAPARYYSKNTRVPEPKEAGLHIVETKNFSQEIYSKVHCDRDDVLLFQVGEFGQLLTNDRMRATKHIVKKDLSDREIERFTMALFFSPAYETKAMSTSLLTREDRFTDHRRSDGSVTFADWHEASFTRYKKKDS